MTKPRGCKDCSADSKRPAPHPGPRCATHHRERRRAVSANNHGARVESIYGITAAEYWAIYEFQGGRCALCQLATGKARRLAVDHDHRTGQVFGLLCGPCNVMLGRLGRGPDSYLRVLEYLYTPPATKVLGCRIVPSTDALGHGDTPKRGGVKPTTTAGGELEAHSD